MWLRKGVDQSKYVSELSKVILGVCDQKQNTEVSANGCLKSICFFYNAVLLKISLKMYIYKNKTGSKRFKEINVIRRLVIRSHPHHHYYKINMLNCFSFSLFLINFSVCFLFGSVEFKQGFTMGYVVSLTER